MELFRMTFSSGKKQGHIRSSYVHIGHDGSACEEFICKDAFVDVIALPKRVSEFDIVAFDEPSPDRVCVHVACQLGYTAIYIDEKETTFESYLANLIRSRVTEHGALYVEVQYE